MPEFQTISPDPPAHPPINSTPGGRIGRGAAAILTALLQFAFYLLYHPLAFAYDLVAWIVSAGEWADWRRCVIPYVLPGRVLEIAHGTGTLSLELAWRGFAVTAVDLSPAMGRIARGKIRRSKNNAPGTRPVHCPVLARADVQRLPFQAGVFNSATATFPADFLFQTATFREVHRALVPDGRLIIIPTAYPEWFAKQMLPEDAKPSSDGLWRKLLDQMEECGFRARVEIVRRPRSRVVLILAEKESTKSHEEKPEAHEAIN
jgi:ubiquinone/menaquinone biosynthesis C-methylase UbiE